MTAASAGEAASLVEVRLRNTPLALRHRSTQHGEELKREMALIRQGNDSGTVSDVPAELLAVAEEVATVYAPFTGAPVQQLDEAFERGESEVAEVAYRVPPSIAQFAQRILDVLARVDQYCREGEHLLMLATPPDVAAYRTWTLTEFQRQIAGQPPRSWPEYLAQRPAED